MKSRLNMKKTFALLAIIAFFLVGCDSPEKSRLAFDKGVEIMYNSGRFADAEEQFTLAIKYDKDNYEAYYYRGCTKFNRSMFDAAILDFEKAIELKPGYSDAEFALGRVYFIKNDFDLSCFYYKSAQQHGRENMEDYVKACP